MDNISFRPFQFCFLLNFSHILALFGFAPRPPFLSNNTLDMAHMFFIITFHDIYFSSNLFCVSFMRQCIFLDKQNGKLKMARVYLRLSLYVG
jgi:hypothetical protein